MVFPNHKPSLTILLFQGDVEKFEIALRETFQNIRFVVYYDSILFNPPKIIPLASLSDFEAGGHTEVWVDTPDGWEPQWGPLYDGLDVIGCLNKPRFWFGLSRPWKWKTSRTPLWRPLADDAALEGEVPYEWVHEGMIYSTWYGEDAERAAFVRRVFRLAKKGASNKVFSVDPATGKPKGLSTSGGLRWIGEEAAAWLNGAPNRFVFDFLRPADGYDTYHWPLPTRADVTRVRRRGP